MDATTRRLIELGYPPDVAADPQQLAQDRFIAQLLSAMRQLPVQARPPAFLASTLRSAPIRWTGDHTMVGPGAGVAGSQLHNVNWTPQPDSGFTGSPSSNASIVAPGTAEAFPRGYVGVVRVNVQATQLGTAQAAALPRQTRYTVLHNGQEVAGFTRQAPGGSWGQPGAVAGPVPSGWLTDPYETGCPLLLRSGDVLSVVYIVDDLPATVTACFRAIVTGWRFPETDSQPTLGSFLVD